jgi:hypothetical protein
VAHPDPHGLSLRDLVLEVRDDVKDILDREAKQDAEIAKRPSRTEVMSLFGLAGSVSGIIFALVR